MTLQQMIGELQTLALAYPDATPVRFQFHETIGDVVGVRAQSDEHGVTVIIEEQA